MSQMKTRYTSNYTFTKVVIRLKSTCVQPDNQPLDSNYINNKLMNLRSLDTKVEDNNTLSDDKKQALKQEIDKTKQSIDRQRNIIIDQLNGASNKNKQPKIS